MTTISNGLKADKPTVSLSGGKTEKYVASQSSVPANNASPLLWKYKSLLRLNALYNTIRWQITSKNYKSNTR